MNKLQNVYLESVEKAGLSQSEKARRLKFYRASIIHKILEVLDFSTSPDILQKETKRRKRLLRQRAFTIVIGRFYRQLKDRNLSERTLYTQARKLYKQGLDQKQVKIILANQNLKRYLTIDMEEVARKLNKIAENTAEDYVKEHQKLIKQVEVEEEEEEEKINLSTVLLLLSGMYIIHLTGARNTFANRVANTVAKLANPLRPKRPTLKIIAEIKAELNFISRYSAKATAGTEAAYTDGLIGHEVNLVIYDEKRIVTMRDDRVCLMCIANSAVQWIPVAQPYPSGHMTYPFHRSCRCDEEARRIEREPIPEF